MSQAFSVRRGSGALAIESPLPLSIERGIDLIRIDPSRNMHRYYLLRYEQDLFGQWLLVRQWGRVGRSRQVRRKAVAGVNEAVLEALTHATAKLRKGYRLRRDEIFPARSGLSPHTTVKSWPGGKERRQKAWTRKRLSEALALAAANARTGEGSIKPASITLTRKEIDALLTVAGNADAQATFEDCREPEESPARMQHAYDRALAKLRRAYALV